MYRAACWLGVLALLTVAQAGGGGAVSSSCGTSPRMDITGVQKRLKIAEALWQRHGQAEYRLKLRQRGVWINADFQLDVTSRATWIFDYPQRLPGKPAAALMTRQATADSSERYTVSGLFAQVRYALKTAQETGTCGTLDVMFDSKDGHLISLRNDVSAIIDDEFTLTVSPLLPFP